MPKTIGEARVRTEFNPSANSDVDQIKQKAAEIINLIDNLPVNADNPAESARLKALAMTSFETGAMWGVKAAKL